MSNRVCLALAWDPRGEMDRLRRFYPEFSQWYSDMVVSTTPNADQASLDWLHSLPGVRVAARDGWGSGRMVALELARQTGADFVHYVDGDRFARWFELYPDELKQTIDAVQSVDYLVIGRTQAAFDSHPACLKGTEAITNEVFSRLIGQRLDLCGGSKGISRAAVEFLLRNANTMNGLGSDAEWAVLLHRGGFSVRGIEVDGLDWETADRYQPHAADAERQRRLAAEYDTDPKHWEFRARVAYETAQVGLDAMTQELK